MKIAQEIEACASLCKRKEFSQKKNRGKINKNKRKYFIFRISFLKGLQLQQNEQERRANEKFILEINGIQTTKQKEINLK